jgi:hypothetical protein
MVRQALAGEQVSFDDDLQALSQLINIKHGYKNAYEATLLRCAQLEAERESTRLLIATALKADGVEIDEQVEGIAQLITRFHGYRKSYDVMSRELGNLRLMAPVERSEEQLQALADSPGIFLVTLPKSGTVYVANTLAQTLQCGLSTAVTSTFPKNVLWENMLRDFKHGSVVSVSHMEPDAVNVLSLLRAGIRKGVLHVRDPRAAVHSWLYYLLRRAKSGLVDGVFPASLLAEPFAAQLDAVIEFSFKDFVNWFDWWLRRLDADPRLDFLVTTHERLAADETGFFQDILDFYGVRAPIRPARKDEKMHFRSGDNEEWRAAFSASQIAKVNSMIPERLWSRFGWKE